MSKKFYYASKVTNGLALFDDKLPKQTKDKLQLTEASLRMATPHYQGVILNDYLKRLELKYPVFYDCTANIGGNFCTIVASGMFKEYHAYEIGTETFKVLKNNVEAIFGQRDNIFLHNEDSVPIIGKDQEAVYLIDPPWGMDYKKDAVISDLILGRSSVLALSMGRGLIIFKLPYNFDTTSLRGCTLRLVDKQKKDIYKYFFIGLDNKNSKTVETKRYDFWSAEHSLK